MSSQKKTYSGAERRKAKNAHLRKDVERMEAGLKAIPKITEEELDTIFALARKYCQQEGNRGSKKIFQAIRDNHANQLSPAALAVLDEILSD